MTYSLMNRDYIVDSFDERYLKRITASLDEHFRETNVLDLSNRILAIEDIGHTTGEFLFDVKAIINGIVLLEFAGGVS